MAFLLDTNVLSELRKKRRNEPKIQAWLGSVDSEDLFTSVIVVGEIRRGIEKIRPNDPVFASHLELWLRRLQLDYQDRILSITEEIAEFWGTICPNDPLTEPDGLIAATALHHGMTLVTRNVQHVQRSGVRLLNPWENF
jgi:predicted nucleic acid-binding protein